ncbi:hypothetical protein NLU13_3794 [Sarocladium strictum]|uniref:Extracellular membrane protein CFEM domain-containing protein n=1 Tax=Sarocladium strictum TaxID=5046 RepID=A0AA39GHQ5_SARSR|nr:hypothetical protein NLU13_3794 [Sarocladium strictum]
MRSLSALLAFMVTTSAFAADLPKCSQTCVDDNLMSSFCDGDEKGLDLDNCTCASYFGSLMVQCVRKCPEADQSAFKATLPESCRDEVLPDVDVDGDAVDDNSDDENGGSNNTSTRTSSEGSKTSGLGQEPTETGESANDKDDGAAGLAPPTYFAAAAVVVGLMLTGA